MASEHSTTTIYGRENEYKAFESFIEAAGPGMIVSLVSDSYDYKKAVTDFFCGSARELIIRNGEEHGSRVVIRPDSGDPVQMVVWTLTELEKHYPIERNERGYKVLPACIGIIYGDGINLESINLITEAMIRNGWAIDGRNVIFGMGGGLLQQVNRDTHKFAIKCSAACRGEWIDVFKQPATDTGKSSKRGFLALIDGNPINNLSPNYRTVTIETNGENENPDNLLRTVFLNGEITETQTLTDVREKYRSEVERTNRMAILR
jgi:nicotinamide phosphoribosyltransferase